METKKPLRSSALLRAFRSRQSYVNRGFLLAIGFLLIVGTLIIHAAQPGWWTSRDAVDPSLQANDFAAVNQGQLKQFTQRAVQEMNATLPGGAGIELNTLVTGWQQEYLTHGWNATTPKPADFTVMTVGQVKHIANKIWTRLVAVHYCTSIPTWLLVNPGTDSHAANLGQLKTVFNFTLTAPEGQLPDWWQRYYFNGQTGILPGDDADEDGLTNLQEYQLRLDPTNNDSDGDGLSDGWEITLGLNPALTDSDGNGVADKDEDSDGDGMPNGWEITNGLDPKTNDANQDSDNDGLTNAEELEVRTLPQNPDTDGDGTIDGEDGWAGNGSDPESNAKQAHLAPPRIPVAQYALIDLGVGYASMVNSRGDVVFWNGSTPKILLQGAVQTITAGSGGVSVSDLNDSGVVCGIQNGGNVFTWTNGSPTVISVPPHASQIDHPYPISGVVPTYTSLRLSNSGDVYAYQWIWWPLSEGTQGTGHYYYGYYEDQRFVNLTSQVTFGYYYSEYVYWEEGDESGLDHATEQDLIAIPPVIPPIISPFQDELLVAPRFVLEDGQLYVGPFMWGGYTGSVERARHGWGTYSGGYQEVNNTHVPICFNSAGDAISVTRSYFDMPFTDKRHYILKNDAGTCTPIEVDMKTIIPEVAGVEHSPYFLGVDNGFYFQRRFNKRLQFVLGDKIWQNYKTYEIKNLSLALHDSQGYYSGFQASEINNTGVIAGLAIKTSDSAAHAVLLVPIELNTKDRVLQGSVEIPEGWEQFGLSLKNKTNGQDMGTFDNLEPGATTDVKIYDSPDDFFSAEEMSQVSGGSLPDNVKKQKVVFARDPDNPRKLKFCTIFDELGDVEVKVTFGPTHAEGIATCKLTADATVAYFVNDLNDRIVSIEVPGSEDIPIDTDGDGNPDGSRPADILQGFNAGTMTHPGALVGDSLEDNPANLVLAINDDNDDGGASDHVDSSDTVISANDNDIVTLLLKCPSNVPMDTGTLTLTVSGSSAVRVFKPAGSGALANYSVNLASPSGDLTGLATNGSVKVFVEGLNAASDVTFTLSYVNGQTQVSDAVHLMAVPRSSLGTLHPESCLRAVCGDSSKVFMRTYADNGAAVWEPLSLVPVGQNPALQNVGMLAKILFSVPLNQAKIYFAYEKGFVDGFWGALKGEAEAIYSIPGTVNAVWTFFSNNPYARAAAAWAVTQEVLAVVKDMPAAEFKEMLEKIPKSLYSGLYTAAERNLPWTPVSSTLSPDVFAYMGGFTSGMITEAVVVSAGAAYLTENAGNVIRGVLAASKAGEYSLEALGTLRKAGLKSAHTLMKVIRKIREIPAMHAVSLYLETVDLPSGRKAAELFEEAFLDKPALKDRFLKHWDDHWGDLPEESRIPRFKLASRRVAELKDLLGADLTEDALEGFSLLQKKLIKEGIDDADRFTDMKGLWKGIDTPAKKQSLNDSLAAYKTAAQSDPNAKFWIKDLDAMQTKGYRYVTQAELDAINANGGSLPVHSSKGWYCSLENYGTAADAKNALQLPQSSGSIVARIEFNISSVENNVRVPFDQDDGIKSLFEFTARAFPSNAVTPPGGGGTQFLIDGAQVPITAITPF